MSIERETDKDVVRVYTMEYYSAMKRNEVGSFAETSMSLETVRQSEVSQKEENKGMLAHICGI